MAIKYDENGEPYDDTEEGQQVIQDPALAPMMTEHKFLPGEPNPPAQISSGYQYHNGVLSADLGHRSDPWWTTSEGAYMPIPWNPNERRFVEDPLAFWMAQQNVATDRANRAIGAANHYQAIRGYQQFIANGGSPAEALTRFGPMLLGGGGGGLGSLAALERAQRPKEPTFQNIAGQGVLYDPNTRKAEVLVPGKEKPEPMTQKEKDLHTAYIKAQDANRIAMAKFNAFPIQKTPLPNVPLAPSDKEKFDELMGAAADTSKTLKEAKDAYDVYLKEKQPSAAPVPAASEVLRRPTMYSGPMMSGGQEDAMIAANRGGGMPIINPPAAPAGPTPAAPPSLNKAQALEFLRQAKGDQNEARKLARAAGFTF